MWSKKSADVLPSLESLNDSGLEGQPFSCTKTEMDMVGQMLWEQSMYESFL